MSYFDISLKLNSVTYAVFSVGLLSCICVAPGLIGVILCPTPGQSYHANVSIP